MTYKEWLRITFGNGLAFPFARTDGNDFASASGLELINASIIQILGTRPGELPWRPEFGFDIEKYRHRNLKSDDFSRIAQEAMYILSRWETRITVTNCTVGLLESTGYSSNVVGITVKWELKTSSEANVFKGAAAVAAGAATQVSLPM